MAGLTVITSNRLETLSGILADKLSVPRADPLLPNVIIVQSRGMQRWISLELAKRIGVWANCSYPFPNVFLESLFNRLYPDAPAPSPFTPEILTFRLMIALKECIEKREFARVRNYLGSNHDEIKRYQLSRILARLFDQYLVFRPEMIFKWEAGETPDWQAQLWRILTRQENRHRAGLLKTLLNQLGEKRPEDLCLPQEIHVFGISYLPPFHINALAGLSSVVGVNLYLMNPCRDYWADIVTKREMGQILDRLDVDGDSKVIQHLETGNPLLSSFGEQGRDFFGLINGLEGQFEEFFVPQDTDSLLAAIQSDILELNNRSFNIDKQDRQNVPLDGSIEIHACHSVKREVEVLHDRLLLLFDLDPELRPDDILVMTTDIEKYAPAIHAVFDSGEEAGLKLPYSLADQSRLDSSGIAKMLLALLDIKESRMGPARIMSLLEFKPLRSRFGLKTPDLERVAIWIKGLNIRWGIDAEDRKRLKLPAVEQNTWTAGLRRMMLGVALPEKNCDLYQGILPYEGAEGADATVFGRLVEFLEKLFCLTASLELTRTLHEWRDFLVKVIGDFFNEDETSAGEIQAIVSMLEELETIQSVASYSETIGLGIIRTFLSERLQAEKTESGFNRGGVTFCALVPMRSIPKKVVCLLGMNGEDFPRNSIRPEFDLMTSRPRPGDRSRRNDDKYLFLEALLSARKHLVISYVGMNERDNSSIPPSPLVSELMDYLESAFSVCRQRIVQKHPLHGFSPLYFTDESAYCSYSKEKLAAAKAFAGPRDVEKFMGELPLSESEFDRWRTLTPEIVVRFFSNPARFLFQQRLGIFMEHREAFAEEREPFLLSGLHGYQIRQEVFNEMVEGKNPERVIGSKTAAGELPHGAVGNILGIQLQQEAEAFKQQLERKLLGNPLASETFDFKLGSFAINGTRENCYDNGLIRFRFAETTPRDLLETWLYHLFYSCIPFKESPSQGIYAGTDRIYYFSSVNNADHLLKDLLNLYWEGIQKPIAFFPKTSFKYQETINRGRGESEALAQARKAWNGDEFRPGERSNLYNKRIYGTVDPFEPTFSSLAERVWGACTSHLAWRTWAKV